MTIDIGDWYDTVQYLSSPYIIVTTASISPYIIVTTAFISRNNIAHWKGNYLVHDARRYALNRRFFPAVSSILGIMVVRFHVFFLIPALISAFTLDTLSSLLPFPRLRSHISSGDNANVNLDIKVRDSQYGGEM